MENSSKGKGLIEMFFLSITFSFCYIGSTFNCFNVVFGPVGPIVSGYLFTNILSF